MICANCGHKVETKLDKVFRLYMNQEVTTARLRKELGWSTDTIAWVMRELVWCGRATKKGRGRWQL